MYGQFGGGFRPPVQQGGWQGQQLPAYGQAPPQQAPYPPQQAGPSHLQAPYAGPPPAVGASGGASPMLANQALAVASDPNAFAAMYKEHLASLTFNSKPVITNLTILAHEHVHRMSAVVAQCLEERILQAPPPHRLPALYALDSISKNIGAPYTQLWSERIILIFMETYRLVDQATKVKMEQLLATWRDSGPGGAPLFGEHAQFSIERSLYGAQGPPPRQAPTPQQTFMSPQQGYRSPMPAPGAVADPLQREKTEAVEQIDRLLAVGAHEQGRGGAGAAANATRMAALRQLRTVIQTASLSGAEMTQIRTQLASLAEEFKAAAAQGSILSPSARAAQPASVPTGPASYLSPRAANVAAAGSTTPTTIPAHLADTLANLSKLGVLGGATPPAGHAAPAPLGLGRAPPTQPASMAAAAAAAAATPANDLIKSLMQAGLLPKSAAPAAATSEPDQDAAYASAILSLDIKLSSSELAKEPAVGTLELLLHHHLPLQCRQCANRFPSTERGRKSMEEHMDWHFRQKRRAKESAARGQSRSWFSALEHWVRGGHDDSLPQGRAEDGGADGKAGADGGGSAAMTAAQAEALKKASESWVVAPTDDPEASAKPCPICKEAFKTEWSEDEEEWIWRNAVKVDGVHYHGSCHFSARVLSESVGGARAAKLAKEEKERGGTPDRERSVTPGQGTPTLGAAQPRGAADPVARIKEEEGGGGSGSTLGKRKESPIVAEAAAAGVEVKEEEGTPSKKVAL